MSGGSVDERRRYPLEMGEARRVQPGAVIQLKLSSGQFGYVQYACPGWVGPVIRVLPGVYEEPVTGQALRRLVAGPSLFRTQYGIDREWRLSGAQVVATLRAPSDEATMPPFRITGDSPTDARSSVMLPDGSSVSGPQFAAKYPEIEYEALPTWAIPFFGTLSWQMETQWTPRRQRRGALNLEPRPERPGQVVEESVPAKRRRLHTRYLCLFPSEKAATSAAEELRQAGLPVQFGYDEDNTEWFVELELPGRPDAQTEDTLGEVSERHGGYFDGNLVGPLR